MTLSTNVYVLDPVDPRELFHYCQSLLTKYDEQHRTPEQQIWTDEAAEDFRDGKWVTSPHRRCIANRIGQNLPGILDIDYSTAGPLRQAQVDCDEDCSDGCTGTYHERFCWLDVDFDTAYGYKDAEGRGCGDLHALLVAELGRWLDDRGVRWEWRNEFTSEVHGDPDRYDRLIDLCSGGFEATAWFQTTVMPAITRAYR